MRAGTKRAFNCDIEMYPNLTLCYLHFCYILCVTIPVLVSLFMTMERTTCPVCSVEFSRKDSMLRHIRRKHNHSYERQMFPNRCSSQHQQKFMTMEAITCPVCSVKFSRKDNMLRHLRTTNCKNIERKTFPKGFLSQQQQKNHIYLASPERQQQQVVQKIELSVVYE